MLHPVLQQSKQTYRLHKQSTRLELHADSGRNGDMHEPRHPNPGGRCETQGFKDRHFADPVQDIKRVYDRQRILQKFDQQRDLGECDVEDGLQRRFRQEH